MNAKSEINSRYVALKMCLSVIENGRSLSQVLPEGLAQFHDGRDRSFTQNIVLGVLRWQLRLQAICDQLLKKKLKAKDEDVNQLILLGLYQILYMDTPDHAAVSETVALVGKLKKPWAKGLVNGVLRNFLRDRETLCAEVDLKPSQAYSHPQWFFKAMRKAYPQQWQEILTANNEIAPITLRNNRLQQSRETLLDLLNAEEKISEAHPQCPNGIGLSRSMDITALPGFEDGAFSVQDGAAQQAAELLQPQPGEHVLDACAAPGGKTAHLLEYSGGQLDLLAIEKEPERLERLAENLHRLGLECDYQVGDASEPEDWWDQRPFDKILLDAPCSATGIIRRHPDIKWHRTEEDIDALCDLQAQILKALWPLVKPGGRLLYATCSVLPQENGLQIRRFLLETADAQEIPIEVEWGLSQELPGRQILPGDNGMDGFYYCLLEKMTG
ncbi:MULTISPECIES: 16S rRNA (cytosine(967)-C(5))-methyltransferase RsmB [Thiomicrorhabdus]|uniref:16S rRNA (cytosine(967)-C(5))-methyltransferase n=1 Tax=Thiomicrorhabdus heinhorstiae TaxID=2748010 RepID=A0ABS0BUM5_9GAMM|nr:MULTISPECIES: 16S rRNA (cytosine(967)-C(5))-methyltransferase RsmB [Thiomicrorhabdus]MBF6057528.1 16S rRNA (cytosine(967)-C(5))-methyltransferase RsmB [Thiomicrorhabdus heinhorstiae]